jgi:membrane protein implicated in regulation of membrane protease activity
MSRITFVSLILGTTIAGVLAFVLHKALAALVLSEYSAIIITALVMAFLAGAVCAMAAIYLGARLRGWAGETNERQREQPPRKLLVYSKQARRMGPLRFGATTSQIESAPITDQEEAPIPLIENGIAHILETPKRRKNAAVVEWTEVDAKTNRAVIRTIDVQTLRRFARLHTPARSEWSGKNATYSECLAFFRFAGWVVSATEAGRGVTWQLHYQNLQRRLRYLGDLAEFSPLSEISQVPHPNDAP